MKVIGIPWSQLTDLGIKGIADIPALCGILQQCDSLAKLLCETRKLTSPFGRFVFSATITHYGLTQT
ncbi:hypothetical protein H2248_003468 [Termitomyces sp. 'cryptogamus']|nr:hypothetical protein H2248_003468 [Termitomyces sp. 'cryptogamus']